MAYIVNLLDDLFSEPYGIDDSLELLKMQHDWNKKERVFNDRSRMHSFYTKDGKHYQLHSDTMLAFADSLPADAKNYLESKVISFIQSREWETSCYRHAESEGAKF